MTDEEKCLIVVDGHGNEKVTTDNNTNRNYHRHRNYHPIIVLSIAVGLFVMVVGYNLISSVKGGVDGGMTSSLSLSSSSSSSSSSPLNSFPCIYDCDPVMHDNYVWFVDEATGTNVIPPTYFNYADHGVTEDQPWGGPSNDAGNNRHKILVKSGRKGSKSVADAFTKISPQNSPLQHEQGYTGTMNFYILVSLLLDLLDFSVDAGVCIIDDVGLGQFGTNDIINGKNLWVIISPNCEYDDATANDDDGSSAVYKCTCNNGTVITLQRRESSIFGVSVVHAAGFSF